MVPHVARRPRQNGCLFAFVLDESEAGKKLEGHLKGISDFLQLKSRLLSWPSARLEAKFIIQINNDDNVVTWLRRSLTGPLTDPLRPFQHDTGREKWPLVSIQHSLQTNVLVQLVPAVLTVVSESNYFKI